MYIPGHNQETRPNVLHALVRAHPLATLVTLNASGLIASHLPMVLDAKTNTLRAHISRANPQWRDLASTTEALAIFAGPHHYISAGWYPGTYENGEEVPTWNYAVVHVYGTLQVIEDLDWLLAHVETLTGIHEAPFPQPWQVTDAPEPFIQTMLKGIIGMELPISRIEGKWKASQNRTTPERQGVIAGLDSLDTPESLAMSELVAEALNHKQSSSS